MNSIASQAGQQPMTGSKASWNTSEFEQEGLDKKDTHHDQDYSSRTY